MDVDAILAELAAAYGPKFARQYENAEQDAVRLAWRRALAPLSPAAIQCVMDDLPKQPPNAVEFKALALQRSTGHAPAGRAPRILESPDWWQRRKALMDSIPRYNDGKDWARLLQAREAAGEKLTPHIRKLWREVLKYSDSGNPS